jgi:hypothetical protein
MQKFIQPGKVKEIVGSVVAPQNSGLRFILDIVGPSGKFDAPLDLILTKKWAKAREQYRSWYANQRDFKPGLLSNAAVASDTWIVYMLARDVDGKVDVKALQVGVKKLQSLAKYENASVHISTLLTTEIAGFQDLLLENLAKNGITTYFYTEPTTP